MTRAIARGLLLLVLLVALTVVWLGSHLDRLVKDELVRYGTEVLQVPVSVGAVTIRLLDGQGQIRNLVIGSPRGFKAPHALQVDRIEVAIDIGSVMGDVVVIRQIAVVAPNLIYEMGERRTNLEAIRANVDQHAGKPAPAPAAKPRQGKKLIVEEFSLRGARAEASIGPIAGKTISVSLPDITLRDIGKAKGGATPDEVGQTIVQAITRELAAVISFDRLGRSAGDRLDKAAKAIKDLFK